jgi:transposase
MPRRFDRGLKPDSGLGKEVLVPRPSKYPEQFRRDAVQLARSSDRSLREIGRELGVNHKTLRNWVNAGQTRWAGHGRPTARGRRDQRRRARGTTPVAQEGRRAGAGAGDSAQGGAAYRYRLGYESLCAEVSDSISWRRFCRIDIGGSTPPRCIGSWRVSTPTWCAGSATSTDATTRPAPPAASSRRSSMGITGSSRTGDGSRPPGEQDGKSPVTGDCHAGICGSRRMKLPPATRPCSNHSHATATTPHHGPPGGELTFSGRGN